MPSPLPSPVEITPSPTPSPSPDPCTGVVCNQPPGPCYDPSSGKCSGGQCSYSLFPAGTKCSDTGGICDAAGGCQDLCTGVVCNQPPSPCYDPSSGKCSGGQCSYSLFPAGTKCSDTGGICDAAGGCQDLCTGVVCNQPPSPCYDPSSGKCSGGQCSYSLFPAGTKCTDTGGICDAAGGCQDPCTGVVCNQPPGPCYDPSSGKCSGGQCSYSLFPAGTKCSDTGGICDAAGGCQDLCTGVVCNQPPGPCYDPSSGKCSGGQCSYTLFPAGTKCSDTGGICDAAGGCQDPCTGVVCNQPPGPCYDPSSGKCSVGKCSYTLVAPGTDCSGAQLAPNLLASAGSMCDAAGECKDPCTGVVCNQPPGPCYDPKSGACAKGKCSYALLAAGADCSGAQLAPDLNPNLLAVPGSMCLANGTCIAPAASAPLPAPARRLRRLLR
ncbi:hypothetical protein N2152v2_008099 [Parachlorella kessleri]